MHPVKHIPNKALGVHVPLCGVLHVNRGNRLKTLIYQSSPHLSCGSLSHSRNPTSAPDNLRVVSIGVSASSRLCNAFCKFPGISSTTSCLNATSTSLVPFTIAGYVCLGPPSFASMTNFSCAAADSSHV